MNLAKDNLGTTLKSIRKELGLTIEEASFLADIHEKTLYRIEHGKNNISMNTLVDKLSVAYRMDLFTVYNKYIMNSETKFLILSIKQKKVFIYMI